MVAQFFASHPIITNANGVMLRDILRSARMRPEIRTLTQSLYPYRVKEGETPNNVAFNYYGSIEWVWLVYFCNNIIDVYSEWPKSQEQLDAWAVSQYGSVPAALATIDHYYKASDPSWPIVTTESYSLMSADEQGQYTAIDAYTWANQLNEKKRLIQLVNRADAPRIALELEKLLNE